MWENENPTDTSFPPEKESQSFSVQTCIYIFTPTKGETFHILKYLKQPADCWVIRPFPTPKYQRCWGKHQRQAAGLSGRRSNHRSVGRIAAGRTLSAPYSAPPAAAVCPGRRSECHVTNCLRLQYIWFLWTTELHRRESEVTEKRVGVLGLFVGICWR